jgi:hypothetical protein
LKSGNSPVGAIENLAKSIPEKSILMNRPGSGASMGCRRYHQRVGEEKVEMQLEIEGFTVKVPTEALRKSRLEVKS